ncbi:solute carrier organic anion transporter family member 2A1 [Poeciliopsis prolifica]|uniref:solute carrier organic anion transporter family member 2A1 n=1 Tax=Poeciliopsis prolifica TaxID=188132 RepID=UPI002413B5FD|nr:solute carrier organic anion transporter family member 2A1 [Poeciliopsis prolifica]
MWRLSASPVASSPTAFKTPPSSPVEVEIEPAARETHFCFPLRRRGDTMETNYPTTRRKVNRTPCCSIKLFVLCHCFLQLSQLLYSAYFRSTISTIEKRYGLNSFSSGAISSLNEVSNCILIVFVSYFGNRVHRPRIIGIGGLLMAFSAMILTLPHFLSQPYTHSSALQKDQALCNPSANATNPESCDVEVNKRLTETTLLWVFMGIAQLLFGVGSVPIQPFGISYIDDFAERKNSPLYIAILFAVSVFGPSIGYLLGAFMLRFYVDMNRSSFNEIPTLSPVDPGWVGAWWMGLLVITGFLTFSSIPYFFFPRQMSFEVEMAESESESDTHDNLREKDGSLIEFLKLFPRMFFHLLSSPLFLLLVMAQCCFSSVIAGLASFLSKFLERQYGVSVSFSTLLVGSLNLPAAALGMLIGGFIMRRLGLTLKSIPRFAVIMLIISTALCIPLFFMGCDTQKVSEVNYQVDRPRCSASCSCPESTALPVCDSNGIQYLSPCHAGCTNVTLHPNRTIRSMVFTNCKCVSGAENQVTPGHCPNRCSHYLYPVIILISLASLIACLSHNPLYMMVLRCVSADEKSFAIGLQFLLMRIFAWLPGPAIFGMVIDMSCIWWTNVCGRKFSCEYYDTVLFRRRYIGLQVGYKIIGIILLIILGWKAKRTQEYYLDKKPTI